MAEAQDAPGAIRGRSGPEGASAIIDNRTALPDAVVREAVMAQWTEIAALQLATPTSFQMYANGGSMLARQPFQTPSNVIEEIRLARQVADTDDDVAAVIGQALATAFGDGMENQHADEPTLRLFNRVAKEMNLDHVLKEMYREYLIASQFTTLSLYTRRRLNFIPSGTEERVQAQIALPLIGILPAENIRVISTDVLNNGELAYKVEDGPLKEWLEEYFGARTTPARRNRMKAEQPVIAAIFTGRTEVPWNDSDLFTAGSVLYTLNPRMVHRTTMAKGASPYPRPLLTANFALLEAKRLLNIMDYALLQGGTNYIVVAKVGSDNLPAQQPEVDNLTDQVRHASRSGVLVGDHRLTIDIITPDLSELLSPGKRKLLGRKLAMALLRIPEQISDDAGNEGVKQELQFSATTITSDRRDIKRHVEGHIYDEIAQRNPSSFSKGPPSLWFPKIILSGIKDFYDSIVKARDRGDIPRKWAVEVLGYDYESGVAQRKRELEQGDDEVMIPGSVPFDSPNDGGDGRPPGSSSNNGRPGGTGAPVDPAQRQRSLVRRRRGEPVRASWDEGLRQVVRVGELTATLLEEFPDHAFGRVTDSEREAALQGEVVQRGPVAIVPVNPEYEVTEVRAIRLSEGLGLIVGQRPDGAVVAKAITSREPHFTASDALERAMRWGFVTAVVDEDAGGELIPAPQPHPVMEVIARTLQDPEAMGQIIQAVGGVFAQLQPQVTVVMPEPGDEEFVRDPETGAITGKRRIRSGT